jgi:predicted NAD/FAD-binding protein
MNVAVIGGGYAGMAAAVTLAEQRVPVTVFEAGKVLGGRARRVEHREAELDNGLHILIGAYCETLRLMRQVGADSSACSCGYR